RGCSRAAASTIAQEGLAGEETGRVRERFTPEHRARQHCVEILEPLEADGDLGVDERVQDRLALVEDALEALTGPFPPHGIVDGDVEEHVGIDERRHRLAVIHHAAAPSVRRWSASWWPDHASG